MSEPLIRRINREQMMGRAVDVEQLIGEDHVVRAIWGGGASFKPRKSSRVEQVVRSHVAKRR